MDSVSNIEIEKKEHGEPDRTKYYTEWAKSVPIEEVGAKLAELEKRAQRDELTGLYNRTGLKDFINNCDEDYFKCVGFLDLDNFKQINDEFGHDSGDLVLQDVARCLQSVVTSDVGVVARWGGDEFIIALRTDDPDKVAQIYEQCLAEIDKKHTRVTMGMVILDEKRDLAWLIDEADKRMFKLKESKRHGY